MHSQEAHTIHKPNQRMFKCWVTLVSGINNKFRRDLIDVDRIKYQNDNNSDILSVVDVFSKYGSAVIKIKKWSASCPSTPDSVK